jgi:DNA polymerase delta subunit 1
MVTEELMMVMDVIVRKRPAVPRWQRDDDDDDDAVSSTTEALLIGRARDHASVCICVTGWLPYLMVRAPVGWKDATDRNDALRLLLEAKIETYYETRLPPPHMQGRAPPKPSSSRRSAEAIVRISTVQAKSVYGFSEEGATAHLKIEVAAPHHVNALRDVLVGYPLAKGGRAPAVVIGLQAWSHAPELRSSAVPSETFNSNLDATQQFMVDVGLTGCQWVRLSRLVEGRGYSVCAREWRATVAEMELLEMDDPRAAGLAPLRVLSFDIEAAGRRGVFPQAEHDPVIQIGMHFHVVAGDGPLPPLLLSLRSCDPIEGATVIAFEDEAALLCAFRDVVVAFDADVFTGYNIANFDWKYLVDRATALGVEDDFTALTRLVDGKVTVRETEYQSAQTGKRKRVRVMAPGRVGLDMFTVLQNSSHRLERYTLNAVAEHFLGDHKEDMPFTQITPMWQKDSASRRTLGVYCLKDAQLPLALMAKLDALTGTIEMARSVGVVFDWVLQRGVMVRNTSLLLRRARERGLLFPNLTPLARQPGVAARPAAVIGREMRYVGATVLEPIVGIHRNVVVLDFSAMYPSLIRAHNLCYSTIVLDPAHPFYRRGSAADDEAKGLLRVCGHTFVSEGHCKGLVPEVVKHLQDCRSKAKRALAVATDPMERQVIKARELAYKIAGNGVYGALGSTLSLLPLLAVAESVTALGRRDIEMVKGLAEQDGIVVYGDTDSVFVAMPLPPDVAAVQADAIATLEQRALTLSARVNARLQAPKKIEYEKTFSTMLLLSKKRYAGLKFEAGFRFDGTMTPSVDAKGVQSVRRDGCPLVRDLVGDIIRSILDTGAEVDAVALVRRCIERILEDRVPLEQYAVKKTLRKSLQDCALPMTPTELAAIRARLYEGAKAISAPNPPQLSYAEVDAAIHAKIALPFRLRIKLPWVMLAWRMRLRDPGSAPVPGESISYLLTHNGSGEKCYGKVETMADVREKHIPVDRGYYLKALRTPVDGLFLPILMQRIRRASSTTTIDIDKKTAQRELDRLIWDVLKGRRLEHDPVTRSACIENSPLARAFARQRK